MKTLVFYGSAREKGGHTRALLDVFLKELGGETRIIDAYRTPVNPCADCRACWKKRACSIDDAMQEIYRLIDEADHILFATPMYFYAVPGPLKNIIDRMQLYWAGRRRGDLPKERTKKGAVLMVGGAPSFPNQFLGGELTMKGALTALQADCIGVVTVSDTDRVPVTQNQTAIAEVRELARRFRE